MVVTENGRGGVHDTELTDQEGRSWRLIDTLDQGAVVMGRWSDDDIMDVRSAPDLPSIETPSGTIVHLKPWLSPRAAKLYDRGIYLRDVRFTCKAAGKSHFA